MSPNHPTDPGARTRPNIEYLHDGEDDDAMQEVWRPIPGYEGIFSVSDFGRVRRESGQDHAGRQWTGKLLSAVPNSDGYPRISLRAHGTQKNFRVHRLVLLAFVGPCPAGKEARHHDNNPANCRLSNLSWGSKCENEADKIANGTTPIGERHGRAKLTAADIKRIRKLRSDGLSLRKIAALEGVTDSYIGKICAHIRWTHI